MVAHRSGKLRHEVLVSGGPEDEEPRGHPRAWLRAPDVDGGGRIHGLAARGIKGGEPLSRNLGGAPSSLFLALLLLWLAVGGTNGGKVEPPGGLLSPATTHGTLVRSSALPLH